MIKEETKRKVEDFVRDKLGYGEWTDDFLDELVKILEEEKV